MNNKGRKPNPQLYADTMSAILNFRKREGYLPSIGELAHELGRGTTATHARLQRMTDFGMLANRNGHYIPVTGWLETMRSKPHLLAKYEQYQTLLKDYAEPTNIDKAMDKLLPSPFPPRNE